MKDTFYHQVLPIVRFHGHLFFSTLQTRRCSVFVVQEIKSNTKRIFYACIPVLKVLFVFFKQKHPQQKAIHFGLYKMQDLFYNLEMMPARAEGEKETNTSQNEWQEGNKNSCQSISQCKIYYKHSVSSYLHGHEQTGSVFPRPRGLTCLTVCIAYKTNHCCKDEEEGELHNEINHML